MQRLASVLFNDRYAFLKRAVGDSSAQEQRLYFDALAHASLNMHASLVGRFWR